MGETLAVLYMIVIVLGVALAVVWLLMPLAVIGVKPLLREILDELRRANELRAQRPDA